MTLPIPNPTAMITALQASLQAIESRLGKVAIGGAKAALGLNAFISGLEKSVSSLGGQFSKFVQLANPATVIRFNRAMENLQSAMGQILTPIMEKMTPIIQLIGNAIASLDEPTKKLIAGLSMGAGLAGALTAVVTAVGLAFSMMGGWVSALIALGSALVGVVIASEDGKKVLNAFRPILASFGSLLQVIAKPILAMFQKIADAVAPLLEALSPLIEAFGELFASVFEFASIPLNMLLGVFKSLAPLLAQVGKAIAAVMKLLGTLFDAFTKIANGALGEIGEVILEYVIPAIEKMVEALQWMVNKIIDMVNFLRRRFNLEEIKKFDPDKNRAQATVKQAAISDVQSFLSRAYTQSATGSGQTIEQSQLKQLEKLNTGVAGLAGNIGKAVADELRKNPNNQPPITTFVNNPPAAIPAPVLNKRTEAYAAAAAGDQWNKWRASF